MGAEAPERHGLCNVDHARTLSRQKNGCARFSLSLRSGDQVIAVHEYVGFIVAAVRLDEAVSAVLVPLLDHA